MVTLTSETGLILDHIFNEQSLHLPFTLKFNESILIRMVFINGFLTLIWISIFNYLYKTEMVFQVFRITTINLYHYFVLQ